MPRAYNLKIYVSADRDQTTLYEYGFAQWGEECADLYYDALIDDFQKLCDNPWYPAVDDIRPGYRRSLCGIFSVY